MPKIKSNKGAAKRFKRTGSGKFKHKQSGNRHILTKNTQKEKRQRRAKKVICDADTPLIRKMLPYEAKR